MICAKRPPYAKKKTGIEMFWMASMVSKSTNLLRLEITATIIPGIKKMQIAIPINKSDTAL